MKCISSRASDQDPSSSIRWMCRLAKINITFKITFINMAARVPDVITDIVIIEDDQVVPNS
jgi:hypothetical protein